MAVNTSGWTGGTGEVTKGPVAAPVGMGITEAIMERVVVGSMLVGAEVKRGKKMLNRITKNR